MTAGITVCILMPPVALGFAGMAQRVYFSFDYRDLFRVNQIRSMPDVISIARGGFQDASFWAEAKAKGDRVAKAMIDAALEDTSVTVVCITAGAAEDEYMNYEIVQSLARGNGLVGIRIHELKDQDGQMGEPGTAPEQIEANGFKTYKYVNKELLASRIAEAEAIAGGVSKSS